MAYWLLKSEPYKFSWDEQVAKGEGRWEKRVRNYQARNNLKAMKVGDQAFFYHSNEGKEIVGIVEITGEHYPDPDDETRKFVTVDVAPLKPLKTPVTLTQMKAIPDLANLQLIKQVRLSVCPIRDEEWDIITQLGGC